MDVETVITEIIEGMREDCHSVCIIGIVNAEQVKGQRQDCDIPMFDHEVVDQHTAAYAEDSFYGNVYFPLPSGKYIQVHFYT